MCFLHSYDQKYVSFVNTNKDWSSNPSDWTSGGGGDGVFDISEYNAVSGTPATYDNLTAALGSSGANIPEGVRAGGMSVKYIENVYADYGVVVTEGLTEQPTGTALQSAPSITDGVYKATQLSVFVPLPSTIGASNTYYIAVTGDTTTYTTWVVTKINEDSEEYVQFRLMTKEWSADVSNWQGVDTMPIENSRNLAESKDVARINEILEIDNDKKFIPQEPLDLNKYFYKYGKISANKIFPQAASGNNYLILIPLQKGEKIYYKLRSQSITTDGLLGDYVDDTNCQILETATNDIVDSSYTAPKNMTLAVAIDKRAFAAISKDQVTLGGSKRLDKIEENINTLQKGQEVLELSEDTEEKWNPVPVSIIEGKYVVANGYGSNSNFNCTDWVYFKKGSHVRIRSNVTASSAITFALKSPIDNIAANYAIVPGSQDVSTLTELTLEYDGYYALSYMKATGFVFEYYGTSDKVSSQILDDISEAVIERVQDDMSEDYIVGYIGINGTVLTTSGYKRKEFYIRAGSSIKATVGAHASIAALAKKITDTSYSVIKHADVTGGAYSFEYNVTESGYYCFSSPDVTYISILIEGNNVRANTEDIAAIFDELDARTNAEFIQSFQFGRLFENIACIGDSMSVGSLSNQDLPDVGNNFGASWLSCLAKMWGCKSRQHYARGGTSCYMWLNGDEPYNLAAMLADPNIYNCYIIAYGHNDNPSAGAGTAFDTAAPVTITEGVPSCPEGYTFAAYYKAIIDQIRTKAPHAMILCLSEYDDVTKNKSAYRQAIIDVADWYYEQNDDHLVYHLETGGVPDSSLILGTHYSTIGYQYIAKRVNEETNKVLYEHRADAEIKAFGSWNTPNERYLRYDTSTSLT